MKYMGQKVLVIITTVEVHLKKITQLGSNWNNGSNAGTFYWNLNNSVGNRNRNISGRLINAESGRMNSSFLFQYSVTFWPCHLAKHKSPESNSGKYKVVSVGKPNT